MRVAYAFILACHFVFVGGGQRGERSLLLHFCYPVLVMCSTDGAGV